MYNSLYNLSNFRSSDSVVNKAQILERNGILKTEQVIGHDMKFCSLISRAEVKGGVSVRREVYMPDSRLEVCGPGREEMLTRPSFLGKL